MSTPDHTLRKLRRFPNVAPAGKYLQIRVRCTSSKDLAALYRRMMKHTHAVKAVVERKLPTFSPGGENKWRDFWQGMPAYKNMPHVLVADVDFYVSRHAKAVWEKILDQRLWNRTEGNAPRSHMFPPVPRQESRLYRYIALRRVNPLYPIYIVSKGRHESRFTSLALDALCLPYKIVVEPQEYAAYSAVIPRSKILRLPFRDLGQGSIPARNWIWDHSRKAGHARHWILDDNIKYFSRRNDGRKIRCDTGNIFAATEDFVDQFTNVAIAGLQYQQFVPDKVQVPPVFLNTRVYSCILIRNDLPFRWRGKFNEDTDLCLRVLKSGHATMLINAFMITKTPTMRLPGGNTSEIYGDGQFRREFAESLRKQHPDVVKVVQKFGRWHHSVDYSRFKNTVLLKAKNSRKLRNYAMPDEPRLLATVSKSRYHQRTRRDATRGRGKEKKKKM